MTHLCLSDQAQPPMTLHVALSSFSHGFFVSGFLRAPAAGFDDGTADGCADGALVGSAAAGGVAAAGSVDGASPAGLAGAGWLLQ